MIPQLQRFYGGDPAIWLNMPFDYFMLYVEEIDRIKAQETLSLIKSISLGNGLMKTPDYSRTMNQLERTASAREAVIAKGSVKDQIATASGELAMLGMEVTKVKRDR